MALAGGTVPNPASLDREVERQAVNDSLAVDLDQPVGFAPHPGPTLAAALAGVLDHHLRGSILNHEGFALRAGMTQLDQAASVSDAEALRRAGSVLVHFPVAAFELIKHGEGRPSPKRWCGACHQGGTGGQASSYVR